MNSSSRFYLAVAGMLLVAGCMEPPLRAAAPRCTGPCVSHEDGYQWAQRGTLTDPGQCAGYAEAFAQGCKDAINDFSQLKPASHGL